LTPNSHIPLLAPKHISQFEAQEYKDYIISLYIDPKADKPVKREFNASKTKKGSIVIRINRKPKWITRSEINILAKELNMPKSEMFLLVCKRKIEIRPEVENGK